MHIFLPFEKLIYRDSHPDIICKYTRWVLLHSRSISIQRRCVITLPLYSLFFPRVYLFMFCFISILYPQVDRFHCLSQENVRGYHPNFPGLVRCACSRIKLHTCVRSFPKSYWTNKTISVRCLPEELYQEKDFATTCSYSSCGRKTISLRCMPKELRSEI